MPDRVLSVPTQLLPTRMETPKFDYGSLPPPVSRFLVGQAVRIRQYCAKSIIQIGKDLLAAKRYLSHGEFLDWVESEVGFPRRTAQAYMRVASWAASKSATVALLPPTALYALSSSGVPQEFVDGVLRSVEDGDRIHLPSLRAQVKALRCAPRCNSISPEIDNRSSDLPMQTDASEESAVLIARAVAILARALPACDFARVREMITSKLVLEAPNLPRLIECAFDENALFERVGDH
jgi:hypothetical protein